MKPHGALIAVLVLSASFAQGALITDFNAGTEFGSLFRQTYNETNTTTTAADGLVRVTSGPTNAGSAEVFVYDTTPADGTVKSTFTGAMSISFDIRAAQAGSSFGIYIINPAAEGGTTQYLALFSFDDPSNSGSDRIRIFNAASVTSVTVGAVVSGGDVLGDAGVNVGATGFVNAVLGYTQGAGNSAVLQFTVGSLTSGAISLGANTWRSEYEIGIRVYDANVAAGGLEFDNFRADAIPEPSAGLLALAGAGSALAAGRRRGA